MKICVYSFATAAVFYKEVMAISRARGEDVEWSTIIPQAPFRHYFDDTLPKDRVLYLYEDFNAAFDRATGKPDLRSCRNNINVILETDKDGLRNESKLFQQRWAEAAIATLREFLSRVKPDVMLFPAIENVEGSLLANLCEELGITVLNTVHMRCLGLSFFSETQYETLPPYYGTFDAHDLSRAERLVDSVQGKAPDAVHYPPLTRFGDKPFYKAPPLLFRALRSLRDVLFQERRARHQGGLRRQVEFNLRRPLSLLRRWRYRLLDHRLFDLTPRRGALPERYVLYAAQVTPEQSINSLAQYYIDQERAIDLLRLALPHGCQLVVKEHPIMIGQRPRRFYKSLANKPGVILATADMPMDELTRRAALVATISGTVGIESYLLDRPCLMFGTTFFKHLCYAADAVESLQAKLADILGAYRPPSRDQKAAELAKLYNISYPFVLFDPIEDPYTSERENIINYLDAVWAHLARLGALSRAG